MSKAPDIRLDRSRNFQSVHGERSPSDPHYLVHYFQDGLPFGADELLIHDDGKKESWTEALEREDGTTKQVRHWPLYNDKMRMVLDKKVKKLTASKRVIARPNRPEVDDDGIEPHLEFSADEVNLQSWLRGELDYEPNEIFAAVRKRYGLACTTKRAVVEELVYDKKLMAPEEVSGKLMAMLDDPHSAAA